MGDSRLLPRQLDGAPAAVADYSSPPPYQSPASHPPNPHSSAIVADAWLLAEQATQEVIRHILPTVVSERRRKAVVEYVQKLIRGFLSSEVFPFGSVPLKTYLPDGDIDLTAIVFPNSEDALAADVRSVLESEECNKDAEFKVKDVQFIHAEVKLVKCLVQNIVIDISFNQIGGLSTLCFLEQVDRLIGKDHLFKRSIILIKAWCYYESRILGAHHGLISTYALETLVLYIFHLFHSSLYGPLAVLYRFLDYYSKFDWDNYCISLNGPVSVSSLPELSVETTDNETPDNDSCNLLLTKEFLRSCVDSFSVAARGSENNTRIFIKKHLNIVDPLRESNNLGRSVSKGNFYRIRSAFSYGARKLGQLFLLPDGSIADEVKLFFLNTMDRHGSGERSDVQEIVPRSLDSMSVEANGVAFASSIEKLQKGVDKTTESLTSDAHRDLSKEMKNMKISSLNDYEGRMPMERASSYKQRNGTDKESDGFDVHGVSFRPLVGDTRDLASARDPGSIISENQMTSASTSEAGLSSFGKAFYTLNRDFASSDEMSYSVQLDSCETESSSSGTFWVSSLNASTLESLHIADPTLAGNEGKDTNGSPNVLGKFSYLTGDYETHFSSLVYAQQCQEQIMGSFFLPIHRSPTYPYHRSKDVWNRGNMYTPMNANVVTSRPPFSPTAYYPIIPPLLSSTYGTKDFSKPRGTGTYFPNMNFRIHNERHNPGRGKNLMSTNQSPRSRIDGRTDISHDWSFEKVPHEPATQALPTFIGSTPGRPPLLDIPPQLPLRPALKASPRAIGIHFPPDNSRLEFGSLGPVSFGVPLSEHGRKLEFANSNGQGSGFTKAGSSAQRSAISSNRERYPQSYQLKDEDDFPPLSG